MTLGMNWLGPGHIVLDRDPAPSPKSKKGQSPNFRPSFIVAKNGWMDHDATWYGRKPRPRWRCVWFMSILAKWLDGWRRHLVWK